MKKKLVMVIVLLAVSVSGCKTARLKPIDPIGVSCSTPKQTRNIVRKALASRGWVVVSEKSETIHAMRSGGEWSVAIAVSYDADAVTIRYEDSSNLHYRKTSKGREYIHENYNVWIERLVSDIEMMGRAVERGL